MRNILYDEETGRNLSREIQLQRLYRVMAEELTELEQKTLEAYYFEELRISEIARRRGVHRSTVHRTLHRAEQKLRRFLKY